MYSRLVRGMAERGASLQSSDQHQQGHLLSRKSLLGVLESRQKPALEDDQEEEGHNVSPTGDAEGKTVDHASQPNSAANHHDGGSVVDRVAEGCEVNVLSIWNGAKFLRNFLDVE
eukprot:scaffold1404_cov37-Cyclotella_meneghiniana.AAC.4